jgi:hypothetical protein
MGHGIKDRKIEVLSAEVAVWNRSVAPLNLNVAALMSEIAPFNLSIAAWKLNVIPFHFNNDTNTLLRSWHCHAPTINLYVSGFS